MIDIIDKELKPNDPVCVIVKGDSPKQIMINDNINDEVNLNNDSNSNDDLKDDDIKFENIDDIEDI